MCFVIRSTLSLYTAPSCSSASCFNSSCLVTSVLSCITPSISGDRDGLVSNVPQYQGYGQSWSDTVTPSTRIVDRAGQTLYPCTRAGFAYTILVMTPKKMCIVFTITNFIVTILSSVYSEASCSPTFCARNKSSSHLSSTTKWGYLLILTPQGKTSWVSSSPLKRAMLLLFLQE